MTLQRRIDEIKETLSHAAVVDETSEDRVGVGTRVGVRDLDEDEEFSYTLVGPGERGIGKISTQSPVGRALLDLEVVRDFAFASVGRVSPTNRDAIPTAADFILRREDIDTVVVFGIVDDRIAESIVSGIARAARTLGVSAIAEHVENPATADKLRDLDVDFGQGYQFGRPQALGTLLEAFRAAPVARATTHG